MDHLPASGEREALLDGLTELIAQRGFATFVSAPLVEPNDRFFPDRWEASARGARTVALRLLAYAGLGQLDAVIDLFANENELHERGSFGGISRTHHGAAAWFAGIHDGVCHFGVDVNQLGDSVGLVGALAHEVAHAYRYHHRLEQTDNDLEERLTDLTTVYLGFGVLTTNGAYRFRKWGETHGSSVTTTWTHARSGYLSPQAMSYLLATQVVARRLDRREQARLRGFLETNQAAYFEAACTSLTSQALAARLRLPAPLTWPQVTHTVPTPMVLDDAPAEVVVDERANLGRPVFRVRHDAATPWGARGGVLGVLAGIALAVASRQPMAILVGLVVGLILGRVAGRRQNRDFCSDHDCETRLVGDPAVCPGCGGDIRGTIADRNDRLAAEEALGE